MQPLISDDSKVIGLNEDMILLRGSSLKNTEFIYGVAVYTGHETKIMKNSAQTKNKFSKLEMETNSYLIRAMVFQSLVCITAALYSSLYMFFVKGTENEPKYLELNQ